MVTVFRGEETSMLRPLALATLALTPFLAQAAEHPIFVGAGISASDYRLSNPDGASPFDDDDTGFKLLAGWRPYRHLGIEASYVDHGDAVLPSGIYCVQLFDAPCPDAARVEGSSLSVFPTGYLTLPGVELFAKIGLTYWEIDGHSPLVPAFQVNSSGADFAWGVGAQTRYKQLALRAEYERFQVVSDQEIGTLSLSAIWMFQ
ncbi:MAG: porin family protein [Gammaproteobacteria bacterium]|nr:porin family protein [Gammaproteobacteria bacterium]